MQDQSMTVLNRLRCFFAISVSVFLFLAAIAKLIAIAQRESFLAYPDYVFNAIIPSFTTQDALSLAATLEIVAAGFMLLKRRRLSSMVACSWMTAIFVSYRLLAKAFFAPKPCHCLGGILDWTGMSEKVLYALPVVLLWYMGVGSAIFLFVSSISVNCNQQPNPISSTSNSVSL
jgi:hypothetical protein